MVIIVLSFLFFLVVLVGIVEVGIVVVVN